MTNQQSQASRPPLVLMQLLFGKQLAYSLSSVARLGVADNMDGKPKPIEEIAARCGAYAPSLYRVMRTLASLGVFTEGPPRQFALAPVGELLKSNAPSARNFRPAPMSISPNASVPEATA